MTVHTDLAGHLTATEAANVIGVSTATVTSMRHVGELDAWQTPLGFLYDPVQVRRVREDRDRRGSGQGV